jgi:hypothetical protein
MLFFAHIYPLLARPVFGRDRVAEVIRPMIQLVKLFNRVALGVSPAAKTSSNRWRYVAHEFSSQDGTGT